MKIYNRLFSLMLVIALLAGIPVIPAAAADPVPTAGSGYAENPLFTWHTDFTATLLEDEGEASVAAEPVYASFVSESAAPALLRDAMVARKTDFTLYILTDGSLDFNTVLQKAYSEEYATDVTTGDYLRWNWSKMYWEYSKVSEGAWEYTIKAAYYDTYEQEQAFLTQLDEVMEELDVWEASDYLKYKTIYDYVLEHVHYDYEGLATHEDDVIGYDETYHVTTYIDVLGNNDNLIYTAYDALCNGKAVCQGFSCLLYAMCRSCGLQVRIQDGSNHSWNIVELKDLWYYLDATWDAIIGEDSRRYLLCGTGEFTGHSPKAKYQTAEYMAAHPLAETAYEPQDSDYEKVLPFRDVEASAYYSTPVARTYEWGLLKGINHYQFGPEQEMTRAMAVTLLYRLAGTPDCGTDTVFSDVDASLYYAPAIAWAVQQGIVHGMADGTFAPDEPVTREQLAAFLYRYAKTMDYDVSASDSLQQYLDSASVSTYAAEAMQWAAGAKLITGVTARTLCPKQTATRGQAATVLYRFLVYYGLDAAMDQETQAA